MNVGGGGGGGLKYVEVTDSESVEGVDGYSAYTP
jgi:hypothetical protein